MSLENKNEKNEYTIGRLFMSWNYFMNRLKYALIGGIVGFILGRTWKMSLIGALIVVIIRYVVVRIIWKIVEIFVDAGNK
ncbi:MAG: hypothetical protein Q4D29_13280 [Lachnospiraceae bacterium]|nr:hypothetical protein [Lachnospiraceae bacterium]